MSVQINPGPSKKLLEEMEIKHSKKKVAWECYKCGGEEYVSEDVEHLEHRHRGFIYLLKKVEPKKEKKK